MAHAHHHSHTHDITSLNKAFIWGIILNGGFVIVEFITGYLYDSIGLMSDAGHNLSDVATLLLSLIAFRLAHLKSNKRYTYGYKKSTILISLLNAVILLIAIGIIIAESIEKLSHPQPIKGDVIAWVAGVGVIINAATALLFIKRKDSDLNVKGAYLHMAADALVSVGVVLSGILISYTGWYVIDPIIGLTIAGIILFSTWNLLHDSIRLSLDGVPTQIHVEEITRLIESVPGVINIHHVHIWAISTTENALTAHIVVKDLTQIPAIKNKIRHALSEQGIPHVTLEFESSSEICNDPYVS